MKSFYRVMLGRGSVHAAECFAGGFIGTDFGINEDLTGKLPDGWREFNQRFIPVFLAKYPEKTKIGAGLACGFLWTVSRGILTGDIVLSPDGSGRYRVGEVTGDYYYAPDQILFHRRPVRWTDVYVDREDMSEALRNSAGSIGTVCNLSRSGHHDELGKLVRQTQPPTSVSVDAAVENPSVFALEKHLEDFLVQNWKQTELGKRYDLFQDENGTSQQYPTDTGPIDILAISKDKKELLIVELKKGRASDSVVGQIQRYMGYVLEEIAEPDQTVRGVIIALEDDQRIRRALRVAVNIEFFRYEISFRLSKV
ncbi:MAG: endonuclease NucS [Opitutaceae bacterium]|nr:endonuclease NucS [Opitutaceae bacterium]